MIEVLARLAVTDRREPLPEEIVSGILRLPGYGKLWTYSYEGATRRFLTTWLLALRWQRLPAFQKLARMVTRDLDGILR